MEFKTKCRAKGCTINDAIMSAISVSLKEYFLRKGDEKTKQVFIGIPVSFRGKPKVPGTFHFGNCTGAFPMVMPLFTDMDKSLKHFHRESALIKFTGAPIAMLYLTHAVLSLPFSLASKVLEVLCSKCTLIISNSMGPTAPFIFNSCKTVRISCPLAPLSNVPGGFAILSYLDSFKIKMTIDDAKCKEPRVFISIFEKCLEDFIKN